MTMGTKAHVLLMFCLLLLGCDALDKEAANKYEAATKRWNAGDYRTAVSMYRTLADESPHSPHADNALYWIGVTQFLYLGETEKALATLQLVLDKYSRRDMAPSAQLYIAKIYERGYNDYTRAAEEYRKAAAYADRAVREESYYRLGESLYRLGKREEAREVWTGQVKEFPQGGQAELAYFRLGTLAFTKGELKEAETFYREAMRQTSDSSLAIKAKFALAGCLEAGDNLTEALKLYNELEKAYPNPEAIRIKIKALKVRIRKKSY